MAKRKLTDSAVRNLPVPEAGQADHFDVLLPAFGVRVSYRGTRSFFVMTRRQGSKRLMRITVGRYPGISLSEARDKARLVLDLASRGIDPRERKDEAHVSHRSAPSFGEVAGDFLRLQMERTETANPLDRRVLRPSTLRDYKRMLTIVGSPLKNLRIDEISKRDIKRIIEDLENTGRLATADQVVAYLGRFFRWAVEEEIIERSPMEGLRGRRRLKSRERVLTVEELHDVWLAIPDLEYPFGPLIQVLLLTGQRKGEVTGMRLDELRDWNANPIWELPAERTKNRLPHLVPIVPVVKSIIDRCPKHSELVFTATGGLLSGFGKVKKRIDEKLSAIRAARGVNSPMAPWVFHDFRRSFSTHAHEKLGIDPHVVEAVLNHVSGAKASVAGVYNRAQYMDGRRDALEAWARMVVGNEN